MLVLVKLYRLVYCFLVRQEQDQVALTGYAPRFLQTLGEVVNARFRQAL